MRGSSPPAWLAPGARVMYQPVLGVDKWYAGAVRDEPFQLCDGTWVAHLSEMDECYQGTFGRDSVHSASLGALAEANRMLTELDKRKDGGA